MFVTSQLAGRPLSRALIVAVALAACSGCSLFSRRTPPPPPLHRTIVVAPVLNLSGSEDFDPLKVTDLIASEFLAFEGTSVIPINLALAELLRQGKTQVETPQDALALARTFGADATVVVAVTEYDPYYPPVIGLTMQWYAASPRKAGGGFDPVSASRATTAAARDIELSADYDRQPRYQIQRVFNAADPAVLDEIRAFAAQHGGDQSPYGWRKHLRSQELWVRYSARALICPMLRLDERSRVKWTPSEATS